MAGRTKHTVDYFPHFATGSRDTLTILEARYGNDGYAFWFKLLERLATSRNHIIGCSNAVIWQLLLANAHVDEEKGTAIMATLSDLNAIDSRLWAEYRVIWCQNFVDNVTSVYLNRRAKPPQKPIYTGIEALTTSNDDSAVPNNNNATGKRRERKEGEKGRKGKICNFNVFWMAYPRRQGKVDANKAFNKIVLTDDLFNIIINALKLQVVSKAWEHKEFIPLPATYLRGKRWEDEVIIPKNNRDRAPSSYTKPEDL